MVSFRVSEHTCCALSHEVLGDSGHLSIKGCSTLSHLLQAGCIGSQLHQLSLKGREHSVLFQQCLHATRKYHELGDSVRPGVQVHGDICLHMEVSPGGFT